MAEKRFVSLSSENGFLDSNEIIADTYTGVCYLYHACGNGGGLCPLVDRNGKPIIDESVIAPEKIGFFRNNE